MPHHEILHIIRNPWGWSEDEVRAARLAAADLIEQQAKEIDWLKNVIGLQNQDIEIRKGWLEKDKQQIEALRGFAQDIMEFWPHSELEGGDLQDLAEVHGLLKPETRTEACGENCACAEYGEFPVTCYRKTKLLTGQ